MKRHSIRKSIFLSLAVVVIIGSLTMLRFFSFHNEQNRGLKSAEHEKGMDNPIARAEYEFAMIRDPKTGTIPAGIYEMEMAQVREIYAKQQAMRVFANTYSFQGPDNLGGRTRAVVYDVRYNGSTNRTIIAGGVSGGIFKSTDDGSTWTRKGSLNVHFSVTSIAQDPRPGFQDTWYYTTGESIGNSATESGAFYLGNGVYKSIDNGETWTRLANSNGGALEAFDSRTDLISKVVVNPTDGDVYIAALGTIYRSEDGGTTWSALLWGHTGVNSGQLTDVVINSTGTRFYAAFSGSTCTTCSNLDVPGVWTSNTGDGGSWTKIAGSGAATTHANWDASGSYGRVVLALAPSDENILYALYYDNDTYPNIEAEFFKWDQTAGTWVDRSLNLPDEVGGSNGNDPFAVQFGYDLVIAVKPDDPNTVFIGGTNIYRSTDGFATNTNTTRIGGYAGPSNYGLYTNSHPDIHAIVFNPTSTTTMLCGNDGGIQRTTNNLAATVAWTDISAGFRTYQYYYVMLDPRVGNTKVLGGAQDNGTTTNVGGAGTTFTSVWTGDGVSVGLSDILSGVQYEYVGSQSGPIYRRNVNTGSVSGIRPNTASDFGLFVTLFKLDQDNTEYLYYASDSSLYRNTSASTATSMNWTNMSGIRSNIVDGLSPKTQISALATTRGTYNPATASLFIGTNERRLYRLDDPVNVGQNTAPQEITGAAFPTSGNGASAYISSISVNPRNDDTILVTFSNYGVTSIWWTGNANAATPTWQNVEGNLTLPSIRSSVIAIVDDVAEYYVGTSAGLFRAEINGANPGATTWTQEGASEIGNAVVSSLALRPSDNRLLVGTHGYGMWYTNILSSALPVNFVSFTGKAEDKQNRLAWKVENEVNNKGYEVERKYRTENSFKKIGFVPAKSANAAANDYQFNDALVDLGIDNVTYRLKQVDIDDRYSYSTTVTLNRKISRRFVEYITVRPASVFIRLNGQSNETLRFRLFDNTGRLLQQKPLSHTSQEVSMAGLPHGIFVIELSHPDGRKHTQRVAL